jgi:hypothetical protein
LAHWVVVVGVLVAAGSSIAAVNWYRTWSFFARLDVEAGRGPVSSSTVESQANLLRWVLIAVISLVVCAMAVGLSWLIGNRWSAAGPRGKVEAPSAAAESGNSAARDLEPLEPSAG